MGKKILLGGFVLILLLAIPLTLFILQRRTQQNSQASASTNLSFAPSSLNASIGQPFTLDVTVDPGSGSSANQVSAAKLSIDYDETKLATSGAGIVPNASFVTLEGPFYSAGNISITISVPADPTKLIQTLTTLATVSFVPLTSTDAISTTITFNNQTEIRSAKLEQDAQSENVLAGTLPAQITISSSTTPTPTPDNTTPTPSAQIPVCSSLTSSLTAGSPPLLVTLTVVGNTSEGTVDKVTFNYGDGTPIENATNSPTLGTNSINLSQSHTYSSAGVFTATAILHGSNGTSSNPTSCSQTITVSSPQSDTPTPVADTNTPTPTSAGTTQTTPPVSGPSSVVVGLGLVGGILTIFGALLLFGL